MKIPKYIEKALERRTRAAIQLINADIVVTNFICKHGINAEEFDYCTGYEIYANPEASAERVRQAILSKED